MFDLMKKEMGIENSEEVEYLSLDGIETIFPDRKTKNYRSYQSHKLDMLMAHLRSKKSVF